MVDDTLISKTLSYWLRHAPEAGGLVLDGEGWAESAAVLAALATAGLPIDRESLSEAVARSDKKRFELSAAGDRIRARQGHSIEVEAGWTKAHPPPLLYHGTVDRFLNSILLEGLRPQARHHVHLSAEVATAEQVGARRGKPVVLAVAANALAQAGGEFFLSSNGVWLVAHVPPEYLRRLKTGTRQGREKRQLG